MTYGRTHHDAPAWVAPLVMAALIVGACAVLAWQDQQDFPAEMVETVD